MLKSLKMQKNRNSLAKKITNVLNTTPANFNPDEEDDLDNTLAKFPCEESENDNEEDEVILSKFRKKTIDLLSDLDAKYAGKNSSRKELEEFSESESEHSESDLEEKSGTNEDSNITDSDNSDSDSSIESVSKNVNIDENFQHFKESDKSGQLLKGVCVRNQLNLWESLLETRIQLQKCLITANRMPQSTHFNEIKQSGQVFTSKVSETRNSVSIVLDKLLLLQDLVLSKYPETKNLDKYQTDTNEEEEIPSDTEDEEEGKATEPPKKKRKMTDYEPEISERFKKYKAYRDSVIQKWNDRTRIASKTNTHSVLNQIEHNLSDKQRLIKRTQLKRSKYTILGQSVTENEEKEEYNEDIYDDDDFYHQLLRELIEVKSADLSDPVQLGRQWIQLQNLRKKMKKKVDTKATKGRKIRYAIHTKLVNYMTPIDTLNLWSDEQKNDFFGSLFGKKSAC